MCSGRGHFIWGGGSTFMCGGNFKRVDNNRLRVDYLQPIYLSQKTIDKFQDDVLCFEVSKFFNH